MHEPESPTSTPLQPISVGAATGGSLDTYIRTNLIKTVGLVLLLFLLVGVLSLHYEQELFALTQGILSRVGLGGLFSLVFITDCFVSPFPPDLVLIVLAKSPYHSAWWLWIPMLGLVSVVAGNLGYCLGRQLGATRLPQLLFGRFRARNERLIARYGSWGVVLGALTPIPFSLTCWSAGLLGMPYYRFIGPSLLRVPRYVAYYLAIAYADRALAALLG